MRAIITPTRIVALALAATASCAGSASAHTSATCILGGGQARCLGTVADHTASLAPGDAVLTITPGHAHLWMSVSPLISIFTGPEEVYGELTCAVGGLSCAGTGTAGTDNIAIHTIGASDGSSATITLSDAPPSVAPAPPPPGRHARRRARHHRHRHHDRCRRSRR